MTGYLKAIDIMTPTLGTEVADAPRNVAPATPLPTLLPMLLDTEEHRLGVADGDKVIGVVDERSMLEGLGRMIASRDDSSLICVECAPAEYSASSLARAIEDADAHLVDLWTVPTDHNTIMATLRVRHIDPSVCVHNLERHGFKVVDAVGASYSDATLAAERLLQLQALLNV